MKDEELLHPADALAIALDRVSGLLGVLSDFYNESANSFSGGNSFVEHAISTASTLVTDAKGALSDLHFSCDLTMVDHPGQRQAAATVAQEELAVETVETMPEADLRFDRIRTAPVEEPAPIILAPPPPPPMPASQEQELFARSYLELLKKLTAAEVFASEQQALSAPGTATELLPLLRGLREEFQKMHNVA